MDEKEIMRQVEDFIALPRAERKANFRALPKEVAARVQSIIEKRRGISHRTRSGELVLEKATYVKEILRVQGRLDELPITKKALENKLASLKGNLRIHHGDDALAEAETALEERARTAEGGEDNG